MDFTSLFRYCAYVSRPRPMIARIMGDCQGLFQYFSGILGKS